MLNALSHVENVHLFAAGIALGKRGQKNVTSPFILPGKVIWAEWHKSFLLEVPVV